MKHALWVLIAVSSISVAQPGSIDEAGIGLIVNRAEDPDFVQPQFTTFTFSVPPEDIDDYLYGVVALSPNGGGGGSSAHPDELGVIHERMPQAMGGSDGDTWLPMYAILAAVSRTGNEAYYYLDLPELALGRVIPSLAIAKRQNWTQLPPIKRGVPLFEFEFESARDLPVRLSGQHIFQSALFEEIALQTGCEVFDDGDTIHVTGCR